MPLPALRAAAAAAAAAAVVSAAGVVGLAPAAPAARPPGRSKGLLVRTCPGCHLFAPPAAAAEAVTAAAAAAAAAVLVQDEGVRGQGPGIQAAVPAAARQPQRTMHRACACLAGLRPV